MAPISRMRVVLDGFVGGPGIATFYALDPLTMRAPLNDLWSSLMGKCPSSVHATVQTAGDVLEDTTGVLTGSWDAATAPVTSAGADGAPYAAPAGVCLDWLTDQVVDGHRLRGRTYVVPLGGAQYQTDGSIYPTTLASLIGYANDFVAAANGNALIWHRPRKASAAGVVPVVTARAGSHAFITSSRVPDKTAVLRSRRD